MSIRTRAALAAALGVTRVARLAGLDRTGVEVVSAVRPDGHVLQVTNGKGLRFADAERGALLEAAELWAAERPPAEVRGPERAAALRRTLGDAVLGPAELEPGAEGLEELRTSWCAGRGLLGPAAWVPLDAVHCPPPGGPARPAFLRWTSSGMGAAPERTLAERHALLEAIERDQLARALPEGFTAGEIARRALDLATLPSAAPRTAALAGALAARGFRVHLLDLAPGLGGRRPAGAPPPVDLGLPCAAAVICEPAGGPVPVAAGYACRTTRDGALLAALLEAAQSRATEIHGAREDVAASDRREAAPLAGLLAGVRARRAAEALPELPGRAVRTAAAEVRTVLERLAAAGFLRAVAVDLPAPHGIAVVKVLVPGLLVSELL